MAKQSGKVLSFHGDQTVKDFFIKRMQLHHDADEIIKGKYWENGKGCAVGCTVHSSSHDDYPVELGICWQLALVEDSLFERLPNDEGKKFPLEFLNAIPVGVDTGIAYRKWVLWILADKTFGLINIVKNAAEKDILQRVANLYEQSFIRKIEQSEWLVLTKEANSASAYASPYAYAYASAYASASAYAEWKEVFNKHIILMKDKLLFFLKELK